MPLAFAANDKGILPDRMIAALARAGAILPAYEFAPDQIQPAASTCGWAMSPTGCVRASCPARTRPSRSASTISSCTNSRSVMARAGDRLRLHRAAARKPRAAARSRRCRQSEKLDRPARRVHPRDRGSRALVRSGGGGYHGPLYAEISPKTFPVLVREARGSRSFACAAATQRSPARRLRPCTRASGWSIPTMRISRAASRSASISRVSLRPSCRLPRQAPHRCHRCRAARRLRGRRFLGADGGAQGRDADPRSNEFYILASKEAVQVPPDYAAEMVPFDPLVGEFRVHYAGFFDPGFGYAGAGGQGSRAVLEVRSREVPFILDTDRSSAASSTRRCWRVPTSFMPGHRLELQAQGLKLSKHLKSNCPQSRSGTVTSRHISERSKRRAIDSVKPRMEFRHDTAHSSGRTSGRRQHLICRRAEQHRKPPHHAADDDQADVGQTHADGTPMWTPRPAARSGEKGLPTGPGAATGTPLEVKRKP